MVYTQSVLLLLLVGSYGAPMDEPIHIDLPVYDQPQASSDLRLAQPIEPETHPGVEPRSDQSLVSNLVSQKLQTATNLLGNKRGDVSFGGIFAAPVPTRETAAVETEGWGSKTLSIKENLQSIVAGLFQPKPLIDTIREEDKYGNTGDKFYSTGRAVVGGAEGISNLVNTVLEVPGTIFRKITRAATEKLNNLGGKLIGLN